MAEELPSDARVRTECKDDFEAVMSYELIGEIRMIDMQKPAGDSDADFSRETILRRISDGYDATRRALEARPLKRAQSSLRSSRPRGARRVREPWRPGGPGLRCLRSYG